jgi:hypothetical protein
MHDKICECLGHVKCDHVFNEISHSTRDLGQSHDHVATDEWQNIEIFIKMRNKSKQIVAV